MAQTKFLLDVEDLPLESLRIRENALVGTSSESWSRPRPKRRAPQYLAATAAVLCACIVPEQRSTALQDGSRAELDAGPTAPADQDSSDAAPDAGASPELAPDAAIVDVDAGASPELAPDAAIVDLDASDGAAPEHDGGSDAADASDGSGACGTCPPELPHCKDGTCVACIDDQHCEPGVCRRNACVECGQHSDCTDLSASRCAALQCVPCSTSAECAHIDGKQVCDGGECVQCTGLDYNACGRAANDERYLCDSLARTCTTTHLSRTAGLCDACVSDAHCEAGQLCVMQFFDEAGDSEGEVDAGHFCLWRQDATERLAPAGSCENVKPFLATRSDSVSIDGSQATVCDLRATTCAAIRDHKPCAGLAHDASCGDPRFETDAYCREVATSTYRCSQPCWSDDDCLPGLTCNLSVTPAYCSPQ